MSNTEISDNDHRGRPGPTLTLLTVAQAARALSTTQKMVRHWLASGDLEMAPTPSGHGRAITTRSVQTLLARAQTSVPKSLRRETRSKLLDAELDKSEDQATDPHILFAVLGSCQPLIEALSDIHDFRMSRGRRYDLASILTLACVAMLCGCRTHANIALWGRYYGSDMLHALGFNKARIPCSLTLCMIFNRLNHADFEGRLLRWANSVRATSPLPTETTAYEIARLEASRPAMVTAKLDTIQDEVPGLQVLAPLGKHLGLPQRRAILSYHQNELTAINAIIGGLVLEGRVLAVQLPARVSVNGYSY